MTGGYGWVPGHWSHSKSGRREWIDGHYEHPNPNPAIHRGHLKRVREEERMLEEGRTGRYGAGIALQTTERHPGYDHRFSAKKNYLIGRRAGFSALTVERQLNDLFVVNKNKYPAIAHRWKLARDYAKRERLKGR